MPEPRAKARAGPPTAVAGTDAAGLRRPRAAERACRKRAPLAPPESEEEHQAEGPLEGLLLRARERLRLRIGGLEDVLERLGPVVLDGSGRGAVCLDERVGSARLVRIGLDHPALAPGAADDDVGLRNRVGRLRDVAPRSPRLVLDIDRGVREV